MTPAGAIKKETIRFPNNNDALAVLPAATDKAEDIVTALEVKPYKAVILILGGADTLDGSLIPKLTQLFGRGIARAALEADAIILDGGTQSGVMTLMGAGVADRGSKTTLLGVAPTGKVTYPGSTATTGVQLEPNHSHFVLVEGSDWGSETATLFKLAGALISNRADAAPTSARKPDRQTAGKQPGRQEAEKSAGKVPALAVVAGGGTSTKNEVLRAVRQNLPLIVVEGSGGFADEIVAARKERDNPAGISDPVMAEIVADGEIHFHLLSNPVNGMERLIIRELGIDKVLMQAWEVFAEYDLNAIHQQRRFDSIQLAIISLGVLGTTLAIVQQVFGPRDEKHNLIIYSLRGIGESKVHFSLAGDKLNGPLLWWSLSCLLIIIPILLTVLITAANRFKQGNKWLLLRAGAESLKREIYRYRARAMNYKQNAEQQLAARVEDITRRTMRTEVNTSSLLPYDKDKGFPPYMNGACTHDDGFSYLTPDRYVEVRLCDQLAYFKGKAVGLEWRLKVLYWMTFIIGGLGAFLAAVNQQAWIALTTAIVAAIGTYMGYRQIENTLTKYNQAATDLANVRAWWNGLSAEQQAQQTNIDSLVEHTEQVLQSELDGWVQQMQNALAELRKGQEPKPEPEKEEKRERQEAATPDDPSTSNGNGARASSTSTAAPTSTRAPEASESQPVGGGVETDRQPGDGGAGLVTATTSAQGDGVPSASAEGVSEEETTVMGTSEQATGGAIDNPDAEADTVVATTGNGTGIK